MIRRDVLKLGSVATIGLAVASPLAAAVARPRVNHVLFDDRFADARAFADAARRDGAEALATGQDVVSLWHNALGEAPLAGLAGLTTYADMVVMRALAAEKRHFFAWTIAHVMSENLVEHRLVAGSPGRIKLLDSADKAWADGLWTMVAGQAAFSKWTQAHAAPSNATLWSWAIA